MQEPIIIDGVDISECPYYIKDGSCSSGDTECTKCIHNFCFYKDMKQLEKENNKLEQNAKDTYDMYKALMESFEISNSERLEYQKTLEGIREVLMACLEFKTCAKCKFQEKCKWDVEEFILTTINEVLNDRD